MRTIVLIPLFVLAACGSAEPRRDAAHDPAAQNGPAAATAPASPAAMPDMESTAQMTEMQRHMEAMRGASGDSLAAMLPMHRQMTANMLATMGREMREMDMKADAGWDATADSLRQDLVRMPEMGVAELKGFLPAHEARVARLMETHRRMGSGMKM